MIANKLAAMSEQRGECVVWCGWINTGGYGRLYHKGRNLYAHRVAWELANGREIPKGMMIDHLCRNRACLRPEHLRLASARMNTVENSVSTPAANAAKTHCVNGHELTPENVRIVKRGTNRRYCRACERVRSLDYFHRVGKNKRRRVEAGDA